MIIEQKEKRNEGWPKHTATLNQSDRNEGVILKRIVVYARDENLTSTRFARDELVRNEAAERAAYLRSQGIAAEISWKSGARTPTRFGRAPGAFQVTVPANVHDEADELTRKIGNILAEWRKRPPPESIVRSKIDFRLRFGGLEYIAWYGVLTRNMSMSRADYGIAAHTVGGEAWERYREMFRQKDGGFTRSGAAWAFDENFTNLSKEWTDKNPGDGWTNYPKSLWMHIEDEMSLAASPKESNE